MLPRVQRKLSFHSDANVVGRRQIDVATPHQAAMANGNDLLHRVYVKINTREDLHGERKCVRSSTIAPISGASSVLP